MHVTKLCSIWFSCAAWILGIHIRSQMTTQVSNQPASTSRTPMPNRSSLRYSPRRVSPRLRAASEMLPDDRSSALWIISRSTCSIVKARFSSSAGLTDGYADARSRYETWRRDFRGQVRRLNRAARCAERYRALNLVFQLAHVSWPPGPARTRPVSPKLSWMSGLASRSIASRRK